MVSTKPPSGMRDYLPEVVRKRRYVMAKAEGIFQRYGFLPLETPTMENLTTLLGKYGDEGDQLLYRILHRGDKLNRALAQDGVQQADLAELGLRYDLTVPLARVVAQYGHQLPRFFKRYQIQPVWRADRPAKGRFREFYQCDVDVTGTRSLVAEAEVLNAISDVLQDLGFRNCTIAINHRVLLRSMIEVAGLAPDQEETALVAIDKLDKIGVDGVQDELVERGIPATAARHLLDCTVVSEGSDNAQRLKALRDLLPLTPAQQALDDLENLFCLTAEAPSAPPAAVDAGIGAWFELLHGAYLRNRLQRLQRFVRRWRAIRQSGWHVQRQAGTGGRLLPRPRAHPSAHGRKGPVSGLAHVRRSHDLPIARDAVSTRCRAGFAAAPGWRQG